jgi:hypothetical protein
MNLNKNIIGRTITCDYNGKARVGTVVKATESVWTIEYALSGTEKKEYRSLSVPGIKNLVIR